MYFLKKQKQKTSKSGEHVTWLESDLGKMHVVENHLLGFTEAENQFDSRKGGCYLWCVCSLPMSVHHFCGL